MKRYFLLILLVFTGLNFVYKSYIYFSSNSVPGKVIAFEEYVSRYVHHAKYSGQRYMTREVSKSPVVVYTHNNILYASSQKRWGYINLLDINDEVTVLINDKGDVININTFFQFWFTFYDMVIAFSVCFVGTIILSNILPEKEKKIRIWK